MARFARFFKAARFNYVFKRMMIKWRNKALIPRPSSSSCEELTDWLDKRARQHLRWLHGPSPAAEDDEDDDDNDLNIIAGDELWKIGDGPSAAGSRSNTFPALLVGRRSNMPTGGYKCPRHNAINCNQCYHNQAFRCCGLCKCGRSKFNRTCFLCSADGIVLKAATAKRTVNFLNKLRKLAKGIETRLKITTEGQVSPSQIPNETLALCHELNSGKLVARLSKFVTPIALELADFPARAVWLTHIVGRLSIAFSGHADLAVY